MALEPLQDVVVLELLGAEGTKTGLVLPDNYSPEKEDGAVFKVLATGPGYYDSGVFIPCKLKKGDTVITAAYGISKFTFDGKKVILSRERDIVIRLGKDK